MADAALLHKRNGSGCFGRVVYQAGMFPGGVTGSFGRDRTGLTQGFQRQAEILKIHAQTRWALALQRRALAGGLILISAAGATGIGTPASSRLHWQVGRSNSHATQNDQQ